MAVISNKKVTNTDGPTRKQQTKSSRNILAAALKPNGTSNLLLLCRGHEEKPSVTEAILYQVHL